MAALDSVLALQAAKIATTETRDGTATTKGIAELIGITGTLRRDTITRNAIVIWRRRPTTITRRHGRITTTATKR